MTCSQNMVSAPTFQKSWLPQAGKRQACPNLPGIAGEQTRGKLNPAESGRSPCLVSWAALGTQMGTLPEGGQKQEQNSKVR